MLTRRGLIKGIGGLVLASALPALPVEADEPRRRYWSLSSDMLPSGHSLCLMDADREIGDPLFKQYAGLSVHQFNLINKALDVPNEWLLRKRLGSDGHLFPYPLGLSTNDGRMMIGLPFESEDRFYKEIIDIPQPPKGPFDYGQLVWIN